MSKSFDRYASLAFMAIGAAFILESRNISSSAYGSNVGPNMFPMGLGIILLLLSLRLFYETFRVPAGEKQGGKPEYKRFLIIFGAAVLYALFLEKIGYVISTFLFLVIGFQAMERKKLLHSVLIAGIFSYGVYYLYVEILKGTLPGWPVWLGG